MAANCSGSYLGYVNKLVDKYNNTYRRSLIKRAIDTDYSALTNEIESSHKALKFKFGDRVRVTKHKNIFSQGWTGNWSKGIFFIDSTLKTNTWTYKIKYLNGEKIILSFHQEELLLSKL